MRTWSFAFPSRLKNYKNEPDKILRDLQLAALTQDIDLIIMDIHTPFLDKPTVTKTVSEKLEVLVNQVGCYGINLGCIDFSLTIRGQNHWKWENQS
jgi:5'-nucleotidase